MIGSDVRVRDITKTFGSFSALDGVSLEIERGEFFSLLGPSGCGKTTLLRIIAGFEAPTRGSVSMDNVDVLPVPPNRRSVNTVFQNYALFPHLTVAENVAFPLRLRGVSDREVRRKVEEYLALVRLAGQEQKKPHQLSGGQKQRVAIARALINEPRVLLLDEPLSALDAKLRQQLLIDLDTIHDSVGITFIYVTHDQAEALSVSDRVAVLNEGRLLQVGKPFEVYEAPADSFVANFIGETNLVAARVVDVAGEMVTLETGELGRVLVTSDELPEIGERVEFTVRPEKLRITKQLPSELAPDMNVVHGVIDEPIYQGFQSKFFVSISSSYILRVFKQHASYMSEGPEINWQDEVSVYWSAEDGYIVRSR
ncbi:MAG: ABC transporter ATP-binding protein [Alkalispirochaetaceae bacterium]